MPYLTRTWQAPGGWKGEGWPRDKVTAFERLMRAASVKRKGEPRLVDAWDDGRDARLRGQHPLAGLGAWCGPARLSARSTSPTTQ